MSPKFKIVILGLGGVGGYIGGTLAAKYTASDDVEVDFVARGEHERAIRLNGLKLITPQGEFIAHPSNQTSHPEQLGVVDMVICCVKSYDLETSITSLAPCVNKNTIILPLLNGVDAAEKIHTIIPDAEVWNGCIYIVSRLIAPGVIQQSGTIKKLLFGSIRESKEKLNMVEGLFTAACINAHQSDDIMQTLWEKFIFISPLATLTSYLDICIGAIFANEQYKILLMHLLSELKQVADAQRIALPENIVQQTFNKMASLPYETTTSMHTDFQLGKRNELYSLTGYVVHRGKELNVPTPWYEKMFVALQEKSLTNNIDRRKQ